MLEKVTPRVDIVFKKVFGTEENKDLLISLINSIISLEDQVEDVEILNPYNAQNFKNDKLSILDIKARGHNGKRYNIEIQISDEADYDKRALFYWAKLYTEQLQKSKGYSQLNKAIGIHILNFTSILELKKYHNVFRLFEDETKFHHFKDIELHTIELKKFEGSHEDNNLSKAEELKLLIPKIKTSLDRWAAFLTRYDLLESKKLPKELNDEKLEKALDILEVMNFTRDEREAYDDHLKWLMIEANTLKKAEDKGYDKGIAEGVVKGKIEGMTEAKLNAKAEKEKMIKLMMNKNLPTRMISEITGISVEEIKAITLK